MLHLFIIIFGLNRPQDVKFSRDAKFLYNRQHRAGENPDLSEMHLDYSFNGPFEYFLPEWSTRHEKLGEYVILDHLAQ